jgi:hypothetical protein
MFTFSKPEKIYDSSRCICDGVSATLKKDANTITIFRSTWNQSYKFSGPLSDPNKSLESSKFNKDFFQIPTRLKMTAKYAAGAGNYANFYLKNVYCIRKSELIGFIHLEYLRGMKGTKALECRTCPDYPAVYRIGLCYSKNAGKVWTFCGDIIGANDTTPGACNIGGVPYLVIKDFLYIYFNEKAVNQPGLYPSIARARLSEVISAARKGNVISWAKYNSTTQTWDQNGITGLGSKIIADTVPNIQLDMHTDAAFCAPAREYLLMVSGYSHNDDQFSRIYLYISKDGIHWISPRKIVESTTHERHPAYPFFLSIASDASSDCSTVGKEFYIYYMNMLFRPADVPFNPTDLPLYRIKVNVHAQ